jgi:hypothetical protein
MLRFLPARRRAGLHLIVTATVLGWVAASAEARQAPPAETYAESLDVRELELTVALPESVSARRRAALGPKDFLVLDDGRAAPVTRVEALAGSATGSGPWTSVIYVDRVLGRRDTVARGLSALGARAEQLVRLGTVEIVVADPDPRQLLAPTSDPERLRTALGAAAVPTRPPSDAELTGQVDLPAVRLQGARLLATVAERDPAGPRALWLLADVDEQPAGGGATLPADALAQLPPVAAALAAHGWSVVTLSLPPPPPPSGKAPERPAPVDEHERFRAEAQGASRGETFTIGGGRKARDYDLERALDSAFQPRAALLREVARASAGALLRTEEAVDRTLSELAGRLRLIYRAGGQPDGRPRPVEVRLVSEDEVLAAARWRRSGVPLEVTRARATTAAADASLAGRGLELEADIGVREGDPFARVGVTGDAAADAGPFRLTVGLAVEDGSLTLHHEELAGPAPGGPSPWPREVGFTLPPEARRVVVMVENVATGAWGVRVFALAKMP